MKKRAILAPVVIAASISIVTTPVSAATVKTASGTKTVSDTSYEAALNAFNAAKQAVRSKAEAAKKEYNSAAAEVKKVEDRIAELDGKDFRMIWSELNLQRDDADTAANGTLPRAIKDYEEEYNNRIAEYNKGFAGYLEWVKKNYPSQATDAEQGLELLNATIDSDLLHIRLADQESIARWEALQEKYKSEKKRLEYNELINTATSAYQLSFLLPKDWDWFNDTKNPSYLLNVKRTFKWMKESNSFRINHDYYFDYLNLGYTMPDAYKKKVTGKELSAIGTCHSAMAAAQIACFYSYKTGKHSPVKLYDAENFFNANGCGDDWRKDDMLAGFINEQQGIPNNPNSWQYAGHYYNMIDNSHILTGAAFMTDEEYDCSQYVYLQNYMDADHARIEKIADPIPVEDYEAQFNKYYNQVDPVPIRQEITKCENEIKRLKELSAQLTKQMDTIMEEYELLPKLKESLPGLKEKEAAAKVRLEAAQAESERIETLLDFNSALNTPINEADYNYLNNYIKKMLSSRVFSDVAKSDTFYSPIYWAADNGITVGSDEDGKFKPTAKVSRGQVVAFLYRLAGSPSASGVSMTFKDVTTKSKFYNTIAWSGESKVVLGYPDGTFRENSLCTRGQIVALLWRMAGRPEPVTKRSPFKDVNTKHTFYKAILWAAEKGITVGHADGSFRSNGKCTRAQMVAFLQRFVKKYPDKVKLN